MPKVAKELTALQVPRLKKPGLHAVGVVPGLYLQVLASGAKTWILRAVVGGKRRDMGLGGYPAVTLAQARDKARTARQEIDEGVDPIAKRREAKSALAAARGAEITFDECARKYIDAHAAGWKSSKHAAQWTSTLENYASPVIGKLQVRDVSLAHIVKILEPIWTTKTETATRLRGRIESVLDWATVRGFRHGDNPARWKGHLDKLLPKPRKLAKVVHHAALPVEEVGSFMQALRKREGIAARALEMLVLTAARSGEVRGMLWDEIDFDASVWTVPADRMKAGKEHRIPLSKRALELLESMRRIDGSPLVFPAPRGGTLSDMTLTAVMRRMEVDAVPHGFRSTFRMWAAERTNYPREVAEHALAHQLPDKVEAAYMRSTLFEKRRRMMDEWAKFCGTTQKPGAIIPMRRKKAAA